MSAANVVSDAKDIAELLASSVKCCTAATAARALSATMRAAASIDSDVGAALGRAAAELLDDQARRLTEASLMTFAGAMFIASTTPEQRAAMAAQDEAEDDAGPTKSTFVAGQGVNAQSTSDLEREG